MQPEPIGGATAPSRVANRITWLLSLNYARSRELLRDGFAKGGSGLRSYHYRLLAALEESGPVTQAELGRSTSVDRSDVANVVATLEQRRLIERTVDPTNRRRKIVTITPAGMRQLKDLDGVVDEVQEQVLAPLSEAEQRQLAKLLRKLVS
jgi:MarR family transcriptional regulator, lower aerobic nicotinate degradation pathway regulator